ncbi:MAG: transposase [Solirubrobacteraceae bacterium]
MDDRLRRIDEAVDWGFVRSEAEPYYAELVGRPSIDPIVLVKLMLVGAMEGIGSMRELLRVAGMRVDIRRFLGYGFHERLPVHQTISHAQTRRFVDATLFERLFVRSVALCREHGLIDGTHLSVDGFHGEVNAALASLRASLGPVDGADARERVEGEEDCPTGGGDEGGVDADGSARLRPQLQLVEPRSGPTPKRRSSNATSVSRSDPDAKLRHKPGQRPHLVHRGQVAVDPQARCVVACLGEQADGHEGDALVPIVERARFACPRLESVGTDQGYAAERVWRAMQDLGVNALVPPQRTMLPADGVPKTDAQQAATAARERCRTPRGVWSYIQRMADAEGVVGELKRQHGMDRARSRGTPLLHVQLLLGCSALNLKRIVAHAGEAASGAAAGPRTAQAQAIEAPGEASTRCDSIHWHRITLTADAGAANTQTIVPAWTISLSLN